MPDPSENGSIEKNTAVNEMPESIEAPEAPDIPENAPVPDNTGMPEYAEIPEGTVMPEHMEVPESTVLPEQAKIPESFAEPGSAAVPETPAVPESSVVPEGSQKTESSDIPDTFGGKLKLIFKLLPGWLHRNRRRFIPAFVIIIAAVILIAMIMLGRTVKTEEPEEAVTAITEIPNQLIPVPVDAPLELNAYPELTEFFVNYYDALARGDRAAIVACNPYLSESSLLRMEAIADYIDHYSEVDVYTKPGPVADSFVCYVYSKVRFHDYVEDIPGMNTMYVCTDSSGSYFINIQNESEEIQRYINEISLLDDVKDLHNRVNVEYNEMISSDDNMTRFMDDLTQQINIRVGTQLAAAIGAGIGEEAGESEPAFAEQPEPEELEETIPPELQVEPTEMVRVRAEASLESTAIGMIAPGTIYELVEQFDNGWSRIKYEGEEVYVKSEYLNRLHEPEEEISEEETAEEENAEESEAAGEETEEEQTEDGSEEQNAEDDTESSEENTETGNSITGYSESNPGRAKVKDNVVVRSSPDASSDQLTLAYPGAEMKVISDEEDGWVKVKYYQYTGYVRAEYLEFP